MKTALGLLLLFCVAVSGNDCDYFKKLDEIRPEEPCSRAGGICTFAADCPLLSEEKNLCPNQRSQGIECCYGVSIKETRCQKLGGHCVAKSSFCNPKLIASRAKDCASDENCCILV